MLRDSHHHYLSNRQLCFSLGLEYMAWPRLHFVVWPKSGGGSMTDGLSCSDILVAAKKHSSSVSDQHPSNIRFPLNSTAETKVIDIHSSWIEQEFARSWQYQGRQQWMTTQSNWERWEDPRVTKPNHDIHYVLQNNQDLQGSLNGEMWHWQLVLILSCTWSSSIRHTTMICLIPLLDPCTSFSRWIISW